LAVASCGVVVGEKSEIVSAIEISSGVAKKNLFGSELDRHLPLLHHYIAKFPVICVGLLKWIRGNLCDRSYFEKGTHSLSMSRFLALVENIAATQPKLRLHCVDLLKTAFETVETSQVSFCLCFCCSSPCCLDGRGNGGGSGARQVGRVGRCGACAAGRRRVCNCSRGEMDTSVGMSDFDNYSILIIFCCQVVVSTDAAVIRHFVKTLLSSVAAPFSSSFVEFVCSLLVHAVPELSPSNFAYVQQLLRVFAQRPGETSLLDQFVLDASQCSDLSTAARALLQAVQSRLAPKANRAIQNTTAAAATTTKSSAAPAAAVVKKVRNVRVVNGHFLIFCFSRPR
jgi:hypothetical protein